MLEKNQLHTAELTGYTAEGLGIARIDGQVVFVHGGVQGEVCVIRVLKVLKNTAFARVEEILQRSPDRQDPDCPHYPACGGCDFRHVSYAGGAGRQTAARTGRAAQNRRCGAGTGGAVGLSPDGRLSK